MSWTWGFLDYFNWLPFKYIPGYQDKGLMDNWSITMGANDRTTLLGPSITFNMGASYSTSYDVAHMLMNSLMNKLPKLPQTARDVVQGVLGNGDIKLVLGPSTSLLYGGPAGSSKRGPFWDRIAGTWWEPRGKGAKYSASGSFSPGSVGKGGKDGLQFFERDQIFGEQVRDGYQLAVMLKAGKRRKIKTEYIEGSSGFDDEGNMVSFDHMDASQTSPNLDDVKKDKFESDLAKCYTNAELTVLEQGDKAAKYGTCLLLLLDVAVNAFAIFATKLENTAKMSPGSLAFSQDAAQKAYDTAKEADKQAAANDLAWIKKVMLVRLIYKIAKIIGMQIMEIFESTERLARIIITNVDNCADVNLADYAENTYLSTEKRAEINDDILLEARENIAKEREDRLNLTAKQIKALAKSAVEQFAKKNA